MKDCEIHIDEDLDIKSKHILNDYWLIKDGIFLNKVAGITKMYDIKQGELNRLLEKHAHCEINHGNCCECYKEMKEKIFLRSDFTYTFKSKIDTCSECRTELARKREKENQDRQKEYQDRQEEIRREKLLKFDETIIEKRWLELSKNELSLLNELICNKTKSKIFANVFKGNIYDKSIWRDVFKFERLGLINLVKNGAGYVADFDFDERINEAIKNLVLKNTNTDLNSDSSASNILRFSLTRKEYKKTDRDPDYGGTFTLPRDIILKANTKYIFGGWILTDGSINLSFTPLANLQKNIVTQENLENEPQLVGDIVKNMFNEIRDDTRVLPTYQQLLDTLESDSYEDEDDDWDVPF